jgi:heat-inducible transcriptional repressor
MNRSTKIAVGRIGVEAGGIALSSLDERAREILRGIVDAYLETGEPTGSRTLSRSTSLGVSPATIRYVMQDLEALGLIHSPHASAGRLPTDLGLRFFLDSFLEYGSLSDDDQRAIEAKVGAASQGGSLEEVLGEAGQLLSGLSRGASLVLTSKSDLRLKHIEFIRLDARRALVVLVGASGLVENRVIDLPPGIAAASLTEASNYLNARYSGRTLSEAKAELAGLRAAVRRELDQRAGELVEAGIAAWSGNADREPATLVVQGHANLLGDLHSAENIERVRHLFGELEARESVLKLLDLAEEGEGVRIFIGSENKLFSLSGSSLVIAPWRDSGRKVIGAIGVIGPMRLNYARIVPMVDYTAQVVARLVNRS